MPSFQKKPECFDITNVAVLQSWKKKLEISGVEFFVRKLHICCWYETMTKTRTAKEGEILRSSRSQMFFKIGALKNFAIFTGKHLCWVLF